ncbi:MAG: IS4 family transposase [Pirellulaceae bacterium]|nr:IS4 family transposase [Pirellulaceae bacterium]
MVQHPGGTLPEKFSRAADLEAFYRLCSAKAVTHTSVLAAHRGQVLQKLQSTRKYLLVIHDDTELDFSSHESLQKLGQIGDGHGRGYITHNSLAVDPQQGAVLGLANQILHQRADVPKDEGVAAKRARESRESRLWLKGTEGLPDNRRVVDVCDRGSDTFEFLEHEANSGRTFVIRSRTNRVILLGHEGEHAERNTLHDYARTLPSEATGQATVRVAPDVLRERREAKRQGSTEPIATYREARLCLSAAPVRLVAPHVKRGEHGSTPLCVWIVRVWEPDPPPGCEAVEWFLLTNHPIHTPADMRRVKSWYEWRWVVEEYHKALKTGCAIEKLQMRDESRLDPAIAVVSVVALLLLQLREAARRPDAHTRRADELVDAEAIVVLSVWQHGEPRPDWSVHEYYLALARLGGYRPRKDCPPGWQILWRGLTKLNLLLEGVRVARQLAAKTKKNGRKRCAKR